MPELVIEELDKVGNVQAVHEGTVRRIQMKGGADGTGVSEINAFHDLLNSGINLQKTGDDRGAIAAYGKALSIPEVPLIDAAKPSIRPHGSI